MMIFAVLLASLTPQPPFRRSAYSPKLSMMTPADASFHRGRDLLRVGEKVSAREIVNVIGRWQTYEEWDSIGQARRLDDFSSGDFYEEDAETFVTNFAVKDAMARRPQRRDFCRKRGLVQRCWHTDNVGLLPFADGALAASIGASASELNAEAINPLAAEIVFDALAISNAGFVRKEECDARRASFITAHGGFDAQAFGANVVGARVNVWKALAVFPGSLIAVVLVTGSQLDWYHVGLDGLSELEQKVRYNVETYGIGSALLMVPVVGVTFAGLRGPKFGIAEANVRAGDRAYLEKMRRRKRGEPDGGDAADGVRQPRSRALAARRITP